MVKSNKSVPFDYAALEIQTSPEFIEKIKEKCDGIEFGYIQDIVRFDLESNPYLYKDLPFIRTDLTVYCALTHEVRGTHGYIMCHRFEFNNRFPNKIDHFEIPLYLAKKFVKGAEGLKDG